MWVHVSDFDGMTDSLTTSAHYQFVGGFPTDETIARAYPTVWTNSAPVGCAKSIRYLVLRKTSQVALLIGFAGLLLSFAALIRGYEGASIYLIVGVVLLAVGAVLYYLASRGADHERRGSESKP